MARPRARRVLIVLAVVVTLAGLCAPAGRTTAAAFVRWFSRLHAPRVAAERRTPAPLPFILDPPHKQARPSAKRQPSPRTTPPRKAPNESRAPITPVAALPAAQ